MDDMKPETAKPEAAGSKRTFSLLGVAVGGFALLLALAHFWAGPFAPQPTLEQSVGESVAAVRDATVRALRGEEPPAPKRRSLDLDDAVDVTVALSGGFAVILGVVGFIRHEPKRAALAGLGLGASAVAFQLVTWMVAVVLVVVLVGMVIANFGGFIPIE